jgi:hypothetical protein
MNWAWVVLVLVLALQAETLILVVVYWRHQAVRDVMRGQLAKEKLELEAALEHDPLPEVDDAAETMVRRAEADVAWPGAHE